MARLARLRLTDDELERFTEQLAAILDHAADVAALDLDRRAADRAPAPAAQRAAPDDVAARRSTATRCWRRRPRSRTAASGCRRILGEDAVTTSSEIAARAAPAGRERSAATCVEEHLGAIDASATASCTPSTSSLRDEARAAADAVDAAVAARRRPGPLAGVPVALKDNLCTRGVPTTCASRILEGWRPPYDATVVARLRAAGAVVIGKTNLDEFAMGSSTENSAFGPDPQPARPDAGAGRVERRQRGGGGRRLRAARARLRHRRLDPPARRAVRRGRGEADLRRGLALRARRLRLVARPDRPVRRRRSPTPPLLLEVIGGHDPLDSTSIPEPAPRSSAELDDGVEGLRVGIVRELMGEGIDADVAARVRRARPRRSQAAGAKVEEASVPAAVYGLSAYYLIAPAEASSNLARYDGVRYGLRVDGADHRATCTTRPAPRASAPR